ncbi:SWIB-domain-containing protein [Myriangium duriaei CBS 260.36]|uniref:SWIB-domain-containing protein n=1 Tax=Myriangium duriaei CBS 260.36 TaxID=1168546 RepID=A0A9P4MC23_9PEZI|nr:SWIB-domain-containing protein [Myriangium duriaei CBS 260.36]
MCLAQLTAVTVAAEQEISYSIIIDTILKESDLTSISAKQVRKRLGERLGYDISHQKRFDAVSSQAIEPPADDTPPTNGVVKSIEQTAASISPPPATKKKTNALSPKRGPPSDDESELSDPRDTPKPKKKRKQTTVEEDDAAFAARLQDEENRLARPTRGGTTRKRAPAKAAQKKKKKSAAKIKDDDDSSKESGSDAEPKERKGGFHKPMLLSQPLSEMLGETTLSRPQTVKKIWEYVRAHELQDPSDKRQIRCDDAMRRVFKSDRVHMFTMNKILNQNLYAQDE